VDARLLHETTKAFQIHVVAAEGIVEVGGPVPADGVSDVALLVGRSVLVDLDDADARVIEALLEPVGVDEALWVHVVGHGASSRTLLFQAPRSRRHDAGVPACSTRANPEIPI